MALLADGKAVLQNYYAKKLQAGHGHVIACRTPKTESKTAIDSVMAKLGLLPGLHVHDAKALLRQEFMHSRVAAGPKYIVLQTTAKPRLKTRWGVYCLTQGVFPAPSPLHLYLPEEFIDENIN